MTTEGLRIAMLSIHSSPVGDLGTRETGGMSVYIREMARELAGRGHHIDIFTRRLKGIQQPLMYLHRNVRLIHLGAASNGDLSKFSLYPHLGDFLRSLQQFRRSSNVDYDLIHSHYWLSGRLGSWLQKLWNRPHLLMYHSLGEIKNRTRVGLLEPELRIATEKELARSADRILAPTAREKQNLVRYYGALPEKVGVVPCGVDLELFRPEPKAAARRRLSLDPSSKLLLYVGRFEQVKGLDLLFEALAWLDRQYHHRQRWGLLMVGGDGADAPESRALRRKIETLEIGDRVVFAGRIEQRLLPPYYSAADFLVIPSRYESFGLVGLEALACGRPVLSTPVGAMEQLLREKRNGLIVSEASPESLGKGILSMLTSFAPPSEQVIRESVLDYCWSRVASTMLAEYGLLLGDGSAPAVPLPKAEAS